MGYYCSCTDVKFFMKAEDIEGALRLLAPTQYGAPGTTEEGVYKICDTKDKNAMHILLEDSLGFQGYSINYDDAGNVVGLSFNNEKWYDDTLFFDIFAKYVEKGSYIEMSGEDGDLWRMIFDGEHCFEENATISWPEYDKLKKSIEYEAKFEKDWGYTPFDFSTLSKEKLDELYIEVFDSAEEMFDDLYLFDADHQALSAAIYMLKQMSMHDAVVMHTNVRFCNDKYYFCNEMEEVEKELLEEQASHSDFKPSLDEVITGAKASVVESETYDKDKCEDLHI